ncbi:putative F-box protein [Raphanus sativus]|uniref:F-box protein At2g04810 n=1 Tax=Raphanus sativus TaxID=3726 RepID=A0A6J0JKS5_RAPSA|nr:putative F-box protein At2g04810 [Raphanus sativus]KAJ4890951.1 putative F-box protein [Raphanus sativus]
MIAAIKDFIMRMVNRQELVKPTEWSKLPPDVLREILETLSPLDSHRAKLVCSDWYTVWKTCDNLPPCPLQIIHIGGSPILSERYEIEPDDGQDLHKNPRRIIHDEGGSSTWSENIQYPSKLGGQNFEWCSCMASYGSWLLIYQCEIYLLNLTTFERINLPTMNMPRRDRNHNWERGPLDGEEVSEDDLQWKNAAVLWIDDTSRDYLVAWIFRQTYLISHKKGDDSWSSFNIQGEGSGFMDAAYRNGKLYVLTADKHINIFDFSRDLPRKLNSYKYRPFRFDEKPWESIWKTRLAVKESGEVLIVLSLENLKNDQEKLLFYVFKMNLESFKWERVYSIGDNEMLFFGHGFTVKAPVEDRFGHHGIKSDTINFVEDDVWPDHDDDHDSVCGVFDLATSRIEWPKKTCYYISRTQWFVPGVAYY